MKLLKHILLCILLLTSSIGYTQNNLIKVGTKLLKIGNNLIATPFNQYSYIYDGVDEYGNIDNVRTALASTTVGTWSVWIKIIDATPVSQERFITFGDTDANELMWLYVRSDATISAFVRDAGVNAWQLNTDNAALTDNTWTHVAIVQDGTESILYIDAVTVAQSFSISTDKTKWFVDLTGLDNGRLGCENRSNLGNVTFLNGYIDEVSFWDTDLTLAQIEEIYNNGKPKNLLKHSISGNLISWFRMGDRDSFDGSNWTLIDNAKSNNGVSVNMEFIDRTHSRPGL